MGKNKDSIGGMMKDSPKKAKPEKIEGFKIPPGMFTDESKGFRKLVEKALKRLRKDGFVILDRATTIGDNLQAIIPGAVSGNIDGEKNLYAVLMPKSIKKPIGNKGMSKKKNSPVQQAAEKGFDRSMYGGHAV